MMNKRSRKREKKKSEKGMDVVENRNGESREIKEEKSGGGAVGEETERQERARSHQNDKLYFSGQRV